MATWYTDGVYYVAFYFIKDILIRMEVWYKTSVCTSISAYAII